MSQQLFPFPFDYNAARAFFSKEILKVTGLTTILEEPETQHTPRPCLPYFSFKFTTPSQKYGDDTKENLLDNQGKPSTKWNSGGVRAMSVSFNCYGRSHEEAYNYMGLWQTALDLEDIQQDFRTAGIAVWDVGTVADLSQLLNTAYEGRAHMDSKFGFAMNMVSDLGAMEVANVDSQITTDQGNVENNTVHVDSQGE